MGCSWAGPPHVSHFFCFSGFDIWIRFYRRPSKKSFWSQHFSSCCWTVVKKNTTILLTVSRPYLACWPWNGAKPGRSTPGRSRVDERGAESHRRGSMTKGFACNEGSVSGETYEDQLRQTSNDLEQHASSWWVSMACQCVCTRVCVCVCPTTHNTIKLGQ